MTIERSDPVAVEVGKLRALMDAAVDAICVIDGAGSIIQFNLAAERLFGYPENEVLGKNVSCLMPEPDRSNHDDYISRYLATGERRIIGIGREVEGARRDGSTFPMNLSVGETDGPAGSRRFVGIIHDLTPQKQAEEKARQLQDRLAHVGRFSVMGEMAAGLAHEINQPLAAITTYAEAGKRLLDRAVEVPPELEEVCAKISDQARRASQVIQNLRGFISKQEVRKELTSLNEAIRGVTSMINADAKASGIVVRYELDSGDPPVLGDTVQLQQVILNLTRNAVDAMKKGHRKTKGILVRTEQVNGSVRLSVTDHGHGVSQQLKESIFHPFVTTKADGLGVGLAISRTIIGAHDGVLSYDENLGGGSIFSFSLPIASENGDE